MDNDSKEIPEGNINEAEIEELQPFKIRDIRKKEKFVVDDSYINGYARILGVNATLVYFSLCRHANLDQESFPSYRTIALEMAISETSVKRGVRKLKLANLITITRERNSDMTWSNNTYHLLDKSEWKTQTEAFQILLHDKSHRSDRPMESIGQPKVKSHGSDRPTKVTHLEGNKYNTTTSTNNTDQHTPGLRGNNKDGFDPKEVEVEVEVKTFNDLIKYYKSLLIDAYRDHPSLIVPNSDTAYLKHLYYEKNYTISQITIFIDQAQNWSKVGGLEALKRTVERYEEKEEKEEKGEPSVKQRAVDQSDSPFEMYAENNQRGENGKNASTVRQARQDDCEATENSNRSWVSQRRKELEAHDKEVDLIEAGKAKKEDLSEQEWKELLKETAKRLIEEGSLEHKALKEMESIELRNKIWGNTVERKALLKLGQATQTGEKQGA